MRNTLSEDLTSSMRRYVLFVLLVSEVHPQILSASFTLSSDGTEFIPVDSSLLLKTIDQPNISRTGCASACNKLIPFCLTFDFDSLSHRCRLFQGDLTTGQISLSTLPSHSVVGTFNMDVQIFTNYGQACSQCAENRFLTCINSTCRCPSQTYFNGAVCQPQQFAGAPCISSSVCRTDLNYTCTQALQCQRKSLSSVFIPFIFLRIFQFQRFFLVQSWLDTAMEQSVMIR